MHDFNIPDRGFSNFRKGWFTGATHNDALPWAFIITALTIYFGLIFAVRYLNYYNQKQLKAVRSSYPTRT